MKIFLDGVSSLFSALWVATNNSGGDVKKWLQIKNKKGITNPLAIESIKNQYAAFSEFQPENTLYGRLESFFNCNFALIAMKGKNKITFKYKSDTWSQMVFLRQQGDYVEYLDLKIKDVLPLLSKSDSLLNLPLSEIFAIYGKTVLDGELCDDTHKQWKNELEINIKVYKLINGHVDLLHGLISVGIGIYEETILLLANEDAYEVIREIPTN